MTPKGPHQRISVYFIEDGPIFYLSKHAQYYTTYKVMIVTQFQYIASLCPYFHTRVLSPSISDLITNYEKVLHDEIKRGLSSGSQYML